LPETEVKYNPVKDYVWLGAPKVDADVDRVAADILQFLSKSDVPRTRTEIESDIRGNTQVLRKALHQVVSDKRAKRSPGTKAKAGRGRPADVYSIN
jgi:predicted ArsR family transcriptional regulator